MAEDVPADPETREVVAQEAQSFYASQLRRRRLIPRAALVGAGVGLVGVAFRHALMVAEFLRNDLVGHLQSRGAVGFVALLPVLLPACMLSIWLVRRFAPEASGSGIPHLKAVMYGLRDLVGRRVLPVKFVGGVLAIGAGMALGREGPTTQMGGSIGEFVARFMRLAPHERQTLIAAGAGAGLTAAFNAPLAGTVFVLEELQRDFTPGVFVATLVATVVADMVTRLLSGQDPVIPITIFPAPPLVAVFPFVVLGLVAGLLGLAYNRGLVFSLDCFARLGRWGGVWVGLVITGAAWFWPQDVGGGYALVDRVFTGGIALHALLGVWMLRYCLTMVSYGSGAPGGIFAPLLVLGALLGLAVGQCTAALAPGLKVAPQVYAVVGMAAYFTAIVRAPLTGIILIVEMTSNYNLTFPLLVASLTAYGVAEALHDPPIYEALLQRDLLRSRGGVALAEAMEIQVSVQAGAPFDGHAVKDLGLPPGCVLVMVHRGMDAIVPGGSTIVQAGDRVTAVVSPQAPEGVFLIRHGANGGG